MKKIAISFAIAGILVSQALASDEWLKVSNGIYAKKINSVAIDYANPETAYAATTGGVYISQDGGRQWRQNLQVGNVNANYVAANPKEPRIVYAATDRGLYRSLDRGQNWERVFRGIGRKRIVWCVTPDAFNIDTVYIGTDEGMFVSRDNAKSWRRVNGMAGKLGVRHIISHPALPSVVYAVAGGNFYKSADEGNTWQKISIYFEKHNDDSSDVISDEEGQTEEPENIIPSVRCIAVDYSNPKLVYLGTEEGIFISYDGAQTFQSFTDDGLYSKLINFLVIFAAEPSEMYAATEKGLFRFSSQKKTWQEVYFGSGLGDVKFIAGFFGRRNYIWIASESGLYKGVFYNTARSGAEKLGAAGLSADFQNEPSIREIQAQAVEYAEVNPEKIKNWRSAAKAKALLPRLSVGLDRSNSDTYDIYTSSTTQYYVTGPDDKTNGWNVNLTWELGNLIWNEDQTSIDVRSRLMVQLRDDVLDEVTRYYFERRKLQLELLEMPEEDARLRIQKELRLQELTADIDALTSGYLSDSLEKPKK